jgi:hypothetical protein
MIVLGLVAVCGRVAQAEVSLLSLRTVVVPLPVMHRL